MEADGVVVVGVANISASNSLALGDQVAQLKLAAQQLAYNLLVSADQLTSPGVPPTAALIDELKNYRTHSEQLANASGVDLESDTFSLATLGQFIAVQELRQTVAIVTERFERLRHIDDSEFQPLEHCRQEAARLRQLVSQNSIDRDVELDSLASRRHPLISVLRLCDEEDRMSDSDWAACHDDVASHYGRQLATALMRGRIVRIEGKVDRPVETVPTATETYEFDQESRLVASEPIGVQPLSLPETPSYSATIFDDAPSTPSLSAQLRRRDLGSGIFNPTTSQITEPECAETNDVAPIVKPSPQGTTTDHVAKLISDNRMSLALHLVRSVELQPSRSKALPPSWLLRSLVLGRHLNDSHGEISRQLDDELREFRAQQLTEGPDDLRVAMSFLTRAAALPAALLAGSSPAVAILRSFKIEPGFSQLYNYCSRIAAAGDRFSEHLVDMFRPAGVVATASELQELGLTTKRWLQETTANATSYAKTSPLFLHAHWTMFAGTAHRHADTTALWCKWLDALSLIYRLLKPVCEQDEGERGRVRQEVAKLTSSLRIEPANDSIFGTTPKTIGPLRDSTQAVIQEAVAIANHWLRLNHQAVSAASQIPPEVLDLREEVIRRSDAVVNELSHFRQSVRSPLAIAAINCCHNVIQWIKDLFESRVSLSSSTVSRHVLNGELLRITGIELNDQWQPEAAPDVVETELLAYLRGNQPSWRQAFDHYSQFGNHEATGRLLEMDVWPNATERDLLESNRRAQIETLRSTTSLELDEVAAEILANTRPELWNSPEIIAIQKRLDRLRHDLVRVTNFESTQRQINQLRAAVRRVFAAPATPSARLALPGHAGVSRESSMPKLSAVGFPSQHIFTGE